MTFKNTFKTSFNGLKTHKTRSVLTTLGIVIGVTAIIAIVSLGEGAQNLILGQIQSFGSRTIAVIPGRQPKGPTDIIATFTDSLKEKDLEALKQKGNVPHLAKVMPIVFGSQAASYGNETYRPTIFGATELFAKIYDVYPEQGRLFTDDEVKGYADEAIIGSKVKNELFGSEESLGQKIKIKGRNLKVIGVFPPKGQFSFLNFDEIVIIPYTTAQRHIFGIKYFHRLVVETDSEENVARTVEDIKITLRNSHGIADPGKDDFFVETQADAMETIETVTGVLKTFLAAIAAISLIVGGIGIMNTMLISVTERTREIGLRKALGATNNDILVQFLLEAVLLTGIGGIIGVAIGTGLSFGASIILGKILGLDWSFVFPFMAAGLGIVVSGAVGLIFGVYPARQASLKSPIEALRYE